VFKKILIILILFLSVSAVYAEDNATDTLNQSIDDAELTAPEETKTFEDIQSYINKAPANSTIFLEGTYKSSGSEIIISKDITLEGINGRATLDGDFTSGIININSCRVTLNNLNFINAESTDFGGAINIHCDNANASINNCTFLNNTAKDGGGIYAYGDINLSVINCEFINNSAGDGGAIYAFGHSLIIKDCKFYNNVGLDYFSMGGAIRGGDNIINCIFVNNSANDGIGGAIEEARNVVNCTFINNHAPSGGALYEAKNVVNCTFINNSAIGNEGFGGAIWSCYSIINCTFTNNTATTEGGAVLIYSEVTSDMQTYIGHYNITISNCVFTNNHAGNEGGAIHSTSNLIITNSTFKNNTADYSGAIMLYSGRNKIDNCTFTENSYGNILFTFFRGYFNRMDWSRTYEYSELSINNTLYTKSVSLDNDLKPVNLIKVNVAKVNNVYYGDCLKIKLTNIYTGKPVKDADFIVKIGAKNYYLTTNSKGIAYFKTSLKIGTYKATITTSQYNGYLAMAKTQTTIKVKKAPTTIKAPKVTAKYKKSKYFKVTVKHKSTNQVVKNIKVKIKVYTDKKYKTYTVKTSKKGVAQINTKTLKKGSHKVVISSGNSNYILSAKSTIKIN